MASGVVETAIPIPLDRTVSPKLAGQYAQLLEASGVVDYFQSWDQMTSWWPRELWIEENTPWATVMADPDSFPDSFVLSAYASAMTSRLGVAVSTDAIRRGPAELMQTMLTLAGGTEGRAVCMLGAGELKQIKPFGYRRAEGLARLEDVLEACQLLWNCTEPVDFDGNIWKLKRAWLGAVRPFRPKFWAMGGGPRLIEIATSHADGFVSATPQAFPTPEEWRSEVARIKDELTAKGRDPDQFAFGLWATVMLHDDPTVIEQAFTNPLLAWLAAIAGRLEQSAWQREGLDALYPHDWKYSLHLLPGELTREEAEAVTSRVKPEMVEKSCFYGSSQDVGKALSAYADAGATWISVIDVLPMVLDPADAVAGLNRSIEVCRVLKNP